MDANKRPNHIGDVLQGMNPGSGTWFKWSDPENKIYDNLVIRKHADQSLENQANWKKWDETKPTKEFLESELTRIQSEFDAKDYYRSRKWEYPMLKEQLDYIYHHGIEAWKADLVKPVKDKFPKP
jgi:hypothetical protein